MRPPSGSYAEAFPDTEEPTQPGDPAKDDRGAVLLALYRNLTTDERRRLIVLADAWFRCDPNQRVLVEATANEFSKRS